MTVAPETQRSVRTKMQLARASRTGARDEQAVTELRRRYRAERLEEHIERALADAPPLSEGQRTRIARILLSGASGASGASGVSGDAA